MATKISVLEGLVQGELVNETDPEVAKRKCIEVIKASSCFERDARKMIITLSGFTTIEQIQKYIFNAYLRYLGMGVIGNLPR